MVRIKSPIKYLFILIIVIAIILFTSFSYNTQKVTAPVIKSTIKEEIVKETEQIVETKTKEIPVSMILLPSTVIQGEPVLIKIDGVNISDIKKLVFNAQILPVFTYENNTTALLGVDLNQKVGNYDITLYLNNGSTTKKTLVVKTREKYETYLAVPEQLGGNATSNQTKVVSTLTTENAEIANLKTYNGALWTKSFIFPVPNPAITDPYGFSRTSGAATIVHKGTDFRAPEGTSVVAMNRGIVRVAKKFTVYGNMIVLDHGLGLMTFYIHLSKINVKVGQLVDEGEVIGLSGSTGYAVGPHLHLSIRIGNVSIDPMKFMDLLDK